MQIVNTITLTIVAILTDQIATALATRSDSNALFSTKTAFLCVIIFITIFTIYTLFTSFIIPYVIPLAVGNIGLTALCIKHYFSIS
ncbi:unnamed protein product, partial [Oppiella nova]